MKKRILITGGSFSNKGAQSMLFITVNEIKKRDPLCEIYFGADKAEYFDNESFTFYKAGYDYGIQKRALDEKMNVVRRVSLFFKLFENEVLGINRKIPVDGGRIFAAVDLVIDISGFALSDKLKKKYNEMLLNTIKLSKKNKKPIILLPQSFGPFDYKEDKDSINKEIKELLNYPSIIYAREKQGKEELEKTFGLNNVILSSDIVLQSKSLDLSRIFTEVYSEENLISFPQNSVAVIPNKQCFRQGDEAYIYELYKKIINSLIELKKNIFIIQHSSADRDICKSIKELFIDEERVHLIEREFSCLEFDKVIQNFDFVICSRYHGCVHSYRNNVPCIILGWAEKYLELADILEQKKYVFDTDKRENNCDEVLEAVEYMNKNYAEERKTIKEYLSTIQKNSCFLCLDRYL